jgi:mercuric ion transport protein
MSKKPTAVGVTGGALGLSALALAFGVCCVSPWAVTLLGVSGAVLLARLAFVQSYVVAATIVLLGVGFWVVYRRPRAVAGCDVAQQHKLRWLIWCAAILVIVIDIASFVPRFLA